jgi:glycosyltransferase involved in cell wall biosynthesis
VRILLLNQYFPPDTAATAVQGAAVAAALAVRHRVTVLCGRPSYDPAERHPYYPWRREARGRLEVLRVGSTAFARSGMPGRISNYLTYLALAFCRALFVQADVILAMTDPPVAGVLGAVVSRLRRLPFVYNIRDLYPEMALAAGLLPPGLSVRWWERLHRWALRRAGRVIVLGEDMRERVLGKGIERARVVVARDGVELPVAQPPTDHPVSRKIRGSFPFVLLHAGNLGFYGPWETLLAAAKQLAGEGVGLVFVGDGALRARLEAQARSCPAVRLLPFRPADEVPQVMAAGDLQVVALRRGLEGVVVPSKLYGILAAGRPVLAVAPEASDVAHIVREAGCGFVADPDDPGSIVAAVRQARSDPAALRQMGERACAAARRYDKVLHLQRFVQAVEEAVPK